MHLVTVLTLIFFTLLNLSLSSPTPDSNFSLTGPVNDNLGLGCTCNVSQSGYYCGFEFPFIIGQCDNNMVCSSPLVKLRITDGEVNQ